MKMKIAGIALVWIGVIGLLKGIGVIRFVNWDIIFPVLLIIAGSSLKYCKHSMLCGMGGKCNMCGNGNGHKCEGSDCGECKAK